MATTINTVVSRLRDAIKEVSDDSRYSNRYLWNVYYTTIKQLIKQDADSGRIYSMSNVWEPVCVEMEPISSIYCDCVCLPYNCTVFRSKKKLPNFLQSSDGFIYRWIATPDLSRTFVFVSPFQYNVKSKIKYVKEKYAFIHDGYLYTPSETYPLLSISAIFDGDLSEHQCNKTEETSVSSCGFKLNQIVQIPDYLENACIKMALAEILPATQIRPDQHPNSNTSQRDVSQ